MSEDPIAETRRISERMAIEQDRNTQNDIFDIWFLRLLHDQDSCLLRDVLRDTKKELFENWMKRRPYD